MSVISVRYYRGPVPRPRPRAGDRRVTKKHGLQIRLPVFAKDHCGRVIGLVVNRGHSVFEWCTPSEVVARGYDQFLSEEEIRELT